MTASMASISRQWQPGGAAADRKDRGFFRAGGLHYDYRRAA